MLKKKKEETDAEQNDRLCRGDSRFGPKAKRVRTIIHCV